MNRNTRHQYRSRRKAALTPSHPSEIQAKAVPAMGTRVRLLVPVTTTTGETRTGVTGAIIDHRCRQTLAAVEFDDRQLRACYPGGMVVSAAELEVINGETGGTRPNGEVAN